MLRHRCWEQGGPLFEYPTWSTVAYACSIWVFLLLGIEAIRTYRSNPHLTIGTHNIPTWTIPLILAVCVATLMPSSSLLGHLCGLSIGYACESSNCLNPSSSICLAGTGLTARYAVGLGYLKFLAPPEKGLRWIESKLNLLGRLPHYVSVDQKTYGRFGVLPSAAREQVAPPQ